ncbi:hypothetical protein OC846_002433 [Tilletia horrida]|uniref:MPN domain-containing protein n=1 Tax=Tilletia horrida TaxID=155126 RepID=A0AAN6GRC2_9BASI|nr:hypothetical protein OC845_001976 [Tilletia horrida]KAK0553592.1 hypothetical protein OC846_002433 [Tilletia horrida]KAK0567558.1 hypothetical protein OC861_002679 [Tilletia horrida]
MSSSISVSPQAYAKVVLHAAKYPASTVRGLLVGRLTSDSKVDIVDAIPLIHNWTDLAPAAEVGCALAQAHLSSASPADSRQIVGVYEAPAILGVREPSRAGVRLAKKIASVNEAAKTATGAVILVVNNSLLLSASSGHALLPFRLSSASTTEQAQSLPSSSTLLPDEKATIKAVAAAVQKGHAQKIVDFDVFVITLVCRIQIT